MKERIAKLYASYVETSMRARMLSQAVVFVIAVIMVVEAVGIAGSLYQVDSISAEQWRRLAPELASFLLILILLAVRFFLLFSRRKTLFWLSQLVWLATVLALLGQMSSLEGGGCTKNMFPGFGEGLSYTLAAYILFSPLYRMGVLFCSYCVTREE